MNTNHDDHDDHDHDRGLQFDLDRLIGRRRLLMGAVGAGAVALLAACGSSASSSATSSSTASTTPETAATDASTAASAVASAALKAVPEETATTAAGTGSSAVPEETAGPYPADGSNGVQLLTESGVVRSDIRRSFGSSTADAGGVPTTIELTLISATTGSPLPGAAVYLWHCDHEGRYSMYSDGVTGENYLRGVQESDADGRVTFLSYWPACYDGRWPHIHYEVYPSVDAITSATNKIATSQLALPDEANQAVFATELYASSASNYSRVSLDTDMVFRDGTTNETPTVTGDATAGYTIAMQAPISA